MKKILLASVVAFASSGIAFAEKVVVVTPYLSQPGTQMYVDGFQAKAKAAGWEVKIGRAHV